MRMRDILLKFILLKGFDVAVSCGQRGQEPRDTEPSNLVIQTHSNTLGAQGTATRTEATLSSLQSRLIQTLQVPQALQLGRF
eukprot:1161805-Pelagomonas_calceolata.AAC.6